MSCYEHFNQEHLLQNSFDPETSSVESYPAHIMDFDYQNTAYTSFAFADIPSTGVEASMDGMRFDMLRSASSGSAQQLQHEFTPALYPDGSVASSTIGSPYSDPALMASHHEICQQPQTQSYMPTIFLEDNIAHDYYPSNEPMFHDQDQKFVHVDPHALFAADQFNGPTYPSLPYSAYSNSTAPSPVPSHSYSTYGQAVTTDNYSARERGTSVLSHVSGTGSPRTSVSGDEDGTEKGRCTFPECGRQFKDLKAHMLTHLAERPEKCPIASCDYHSKGFARKYDRNRHVLTHYRGSMVCGFCPGSGSPGEKLFNRADVFKRHLTTLHNVEQNPPNSRKRSPNTSAKKLTSYCPDATGKCSTCSVTFNNAQDFYDHLDECVLRVVQLEEPSEAINAKLLGDISSDPAVKKTFERHMIKQEDDSKTYNFDEEQEEDDEEDEDEDDESMERSGKTGSRVARVQSTHVVINGRVGKSKPGKKGLTWSKIGVPLVGKGRKRRQHYPPSWGMSADKMKMRKRVLCVNDGPRRLLKDDMMLDNAYEVRMRLPNSDRYVTDLDVETLKRANAFHNATPEEKGPWIPEQDFLEFMS